MEQKLLWGKALQIGIFDESVRFRTQVCLEEVGQRAITEPIHNAFPHDVLLPNKSNNLRKVLKLPFGPGCCHDGDVVAKSDRILDMFTADITYLIQHVVHLNLKRLDQ